MRSRPAGGAKKDKVVVSVALHAGGDAPDTAVHVWAVPRAVLPFMNCTVPVGLALAPVPVAATVAVKVTLLPEETLAEELVTVVVVATPTFSVNGDDVEVA